MRGVTDTAKLTCVTGASGFIGSYVVRDLLEAGYRVRATVRNKDDEGKTAHLRKLAEEHPGELELFSADLLVPGSFDEAIDGCESVFHVASAVFLAAKDPQRDIVDPAVEGTENVFASIVKAGTVKRVGLTSSIAAIMATAPDRDHVYSEEDWLEDATLDTNPYGLAKVRAERVAWRVHDELNKGGNAFSLMVVNPVLVTGPPMARVHLRSSLSVVRDLLRSAFKGCPNLGFNVVDVRDVTRALIKGTEEGVTGRHILHTEWMWMADIAKLLRPEFPEYKVKVNKLPNVALYVAAMFDARLTWAYLRRNLGKRSKVTSRKVQDELGIELMNVDASVLETARSIIEQGFVESKK